MKPEPVIPIDNEGEQEFYDSYVRSRGVAADRIKRRYENLQRRIQRLEHTVTKPEFDWEERLNSDPWSLKDTTSNRKFFSNTQILCL